MVLTPNHLGFIGVLRLGFCQDVSFLQGGRRFIWSSPLPSWLLFAVTCKNIFLGPCSQRSDARSLLCELLWGKEQSLTHRRLSCAGGQSRSLLRPSVQVAADEMMALPAECGSWEFVVGAHELFLLASAFRCPSASEQRQRRTRQNLSDRKVLAETPFRCLVSGKTGTFLQQGRGHQDLS